MGKMIEFAEVSRWWKHDLEEVQDHDIAESCGSGALAGSTKHSISYDKQDSSKYRSASCDR